MPFCDHNNGTLIRVKLTPSARKQQVSNCLQTPHGTALKITVRAVPEDGKANIALCRLLANSLNCPKTDVHLVSGQTQRIKMVWVAHLTPPQVADKLGVPYVPE
jgi:hypothetical protein